VINTLTNAVDTINESNKELAQIANFIEEIHDKTKIINSIVVKTELLSFNASIEAARAAEYGMGFAVVAEEVGNLARLSGESAKEIENLLHTSGEKVVEIIESIKERVKHGKERTEECVNVFGKIDKLTEELTEKVNSITQASNEQEKGIMQTTEAMTEISNATQNNLKTTKDASSMANTVKSEINDLSSTINQLKELIETENRLKEENLRNQLQKKGILTEDQIEASSKV